MKYEKVKKYLEKIKISGKFDKDFIDQLIKGLDDKYDGAYIAQCILEIIKNRYAENQKNLP